MYRETGSCGPSETRDGFREAAARAAGEDAETVWSSESVDGLGLRRLVAAFVDGDRFVLVRALGAAASDDPHVFVEIDGTADEIAGSVPDGDAPVYGMPGERRLVYADMDRLEGPGSGLASPLRPVLGCVAGERIVVGTIEGPGGHEIVVVTSSGSRDASVSAVQFHGRPTGLSPAYGFAGR